MTLTFQIAAAVFLVAAFFVATARVRYPHVRELEVRHKPAELRFRSGGAGSES